MSALTDAQHQARLALLQSRERLSGGAHQREGVLALLAHPAFALFDEVGCGKTKQIVDAAQILYTEGSLDTVLVVTVGYARSTWADPDPVLGEVAKHTWEDLPSVISEYHKKADEIRWTPRALNWVVTNYEFVRREDRLAYLLHTLRGRRTWLTLDEAWAVKGNSDQMKACRTLRFKRAERATILNGTPLSDGKPIDLYYPFYILDPAIIGVQNKTHFKARYCVMGGFNNKQIIKYQNLDDLNRRIAPYVLSRRTRDYFDLPPVLPPVTLEARLAPKTWGLYTSMRDDMVAWLNTQASVAAQAITKTLRLSQLTSGYLGGLEEMQVCPTCQGVFAEDCETCHGDGVLAQSAVTTQEVGREKLDVFLRWLEAQETPPHKMLVLTRFIKERQRTATELTRFYPHVYQLPGPERQLAKAALAPGGNPESAVVVGNPRACGASLNFSAAHTVVYLSNGPALIERTQSMGRIERPGATQPITVVDVMACGPAGQKTVDHLILKSLRQKQDMADWTVETWRKLAGQEF